MNAMEISITAKEAGTQMELHVTESMETDEMMQAVRESSVQGTSPEQQEMADFSSELEKTSGAQEAAERKEMLGYSSDYYEHKMSSALESGNKIAYNNAKKHWASAKVKEECD